MEDIKCRGYAGDIPVYCAHDKIVDAGELRPNPKNPNKHPAEQIDLLAKIIRVQGWRAPVTVSTRSGLIVRGHGRHEAAMLIGCPCPVDFQHYDSEEAELSDLVADNRLAELSDIDNGMLAQIFSDIDMDGAGLTGYSHDDISAIFQQIELADEPAIEIAEPAENPSLAERFIFTPTTVLNARDGEWKRRKDAWLSVGIKSEVGREKELTYAVSVGDAGFYNKKAQKEKELGVTLSTREFLEKYYELGNSTDNSTSIFDPVLCELCIKWFSGAGSRILDPFSGGSVRGIVSALTGRIYTGIDLRPEQIDANKMQWNRIKGNYPDVTEPHWITGDSLKTIPMLDGKYDMIMSCPPYADLEVYSDDPADLSNMEYDDFLAAYREIIRLAVERLEDDRFAVFVVGEVRGKDGNYISFVPDTIKAFEDAGAAFYNEAILVTPISGMRFRIGRMFENSRKLGKTHQNVLVFVKGDPKKATAFCGDVSGSLPVEFTDEACEQE